MTERRFWKEDVKNKFESEESVDTRRGKPSIVSVVVTMMFFYLKFSIVKISILRIFILKKTRDFFRAQYS